MIEIKTLIQNHIQKIISLTENLITFININNNTLNIDQNIIDKLSKTLKQIEELKFHITSNRNITLSLQTLRITTENEIRILSIISKQLTNKTLEQKKKDPRMAKAIKNNLNTIKIIVKEIKTSIKIIDELLQKIEYTSKYTIPKKIGKITLPNKLYSQALKYSNNQYLQYILHLLEITDENTSMIVDKFNHILQQIAEASSIDSTNGTIYETAATTIELLLEKILQNRPTINNISNSRELQALLEQIIKYGTEMRKSNRILFEIVKTKILKNKIVSTPSIIRLIKLIKDIALDIKTNKQIQKQITTAKDIIAEIMKNRSWIDNPIKSSLPLNRQIVLRKEYIKEYNTLADNLRKETINALKTYAKEYTLLKKQNTEFQRLSQQYAEFLSIFKKYTDTLIKYFTKHISKDEPKGKIINKLNFIERVINIGEEISKRTQQIACIQSSIKNINYILNNMKRQLERIIKLN